MSSIGLSIARQEGPGRAEPVEWSFGPFVIQPRSRTLLLGDRSVAIGGRAFDLLCALAERAGTIISRQELMDAVWPTTTVEDSNLRFQMACLRRVLGPYRTLIKTVAGRGYLLSDCRAADRHHLGQAWSVDAKKAASTVIRATPSPIAVPIRFGGGTLLGAGLAIRLPSVARPMVFSSAPLHTGIEIAFLPAPRYARPSMKAHPPQRS